jgi:hypothetical protein
MASPVYTPTASQWASAATHLSLRNDPIDGWRTVRIAGVRYVRMVSGNSGKIYLVRADARGCECCWYAKTLATCSHMVALELAALHDDILETAALPAVSLADLRLMFPGCAAGCGQITEGNLFCEDCSAKRERSERLAAARRRVAEAWV